MNRAEYDDKIQNLVEQTIRQVEKTRRANYNERPISRTQLAAVCSATESGGFNGAAKLVAERRRRDRKNEQAQRERKGGKKPKNPSFWIVLDKVLKGDLESLSEHVESRDAVAILFSRRLAIEYQYHLRMEGR